MAIITGIVKIAGQAKVKVLSGWRSVTSWQAIDTTWDQWY